MSIALGFQPEEVRWIYIRTFNKLQLATLESMGTNIESRGGHFHETDFIERVELVPDETKNLDKLKEMAKRREFLLFGRSKAKASIN